MEKLKVMLIDDETLIRKLIRMKIDWESLHMEVVAEFSSSKKALSEVEVIEPDIIITDICMPGMNGIEFSEACIGLMPHIKIMIVTGYDEFDYARRSVHIGVADYILKPINGEEITKSLKHMSRKIYQERAKKKEYEALAAQIEENIPIFCETYLNEMLLSPQPNEMFLKKMAYYGEIFNPDSSQIQVAVLELSMPFKNVEQKDEDDELSLYLKARQLAEDFFSGDNYFWFCRDGLGRIVILSNNPKVPFLECLGLLKKMLNMRLKCYITIGIGLMKEEYSQITSSYKEAIEALRYKVVKGNDCIIYYAEMREDKETIATAQEDSWNEDNEMNSDSVKEDEKENLIYVGTLAKVMAIRQEEKTSSLIHDILLFMEENLADSELSMNKVAEHAFISTGYLGRILKKYTGKTYGEYLSELRFNKIKELLKETDLKGYEIGEKIGILDAHYLSIWFKKMSGYSLSEYRRMKKGTKNEID